MNTALAPTPIVRAVRILLGRSVGSPALFRAVVNDKVGLEIGGPSSVFSNRGILPLYPYVLRLDNCVYASQTLWGNRREEGWAFHYHDRKQVGYQFIQEATCLASVADSSYDFVLSSHSLEHLANPVKGLKEWTRVIREGGALVVVLPHFKYTFDRRRRVTPVSHMLEDYERGTGENDETHFREILEFHDLALHPEPITRERLRSGILDNLTTRCAHHHVFDERNSAELLEACGLAVKSVQVIRPHHIVLLATKSRHQQDPM
jgi:SAM-dependent methyltransferase